MKQLITALLVFAILFSACKKDQPAPVTPSLTTTAITNLSYNAATSGGTITSNGGSAITVSGICWSKSNLTPTISDSIAMGTTTSGSFIGVMNNLMGSTTYYVRAYATNMVGTGYGNVVTFNTSIDTTKVTFTYNGVTVAYGVIKSPVTGRQWLDRNLGASEAATAFDDYLAYGDLFQWGRPADGHQLITWTNSTTGVGVNGIDTILATSDTPGNSTFITPVYTNLYPPIWQNDWRNDLNNNRWAVNNQGPCPSGWHVPTTAEWQAETGLTNSTTGYNELKLTVAGHRYGEVDGTGQEGKVNGEGLYGDFWESSISGFVGVAIEAQIAGASFAPSVGADRCFGYSVRCIKN